MKRTNRVGVTLLELLIVVGIMLLITSVAVTAFVPSLSSRRITEAARQIDVFLSTAKSRAMENGRSAGVRFIVDPVLQSVFTLELVETPIPYNGDYFDSRIAATYDEAADTYTTQTDDFLSGDTGWIPLVQNGDLIRFGHEGRIFIINGTPEAFTDSNSNALWDDAEPFIDSNGDGDWDAGELYTDANFDGDYDAAEGYTDSDSSGSYTACALPWTYTAIDGSGAHIPNGVVDTINYIMPRSDPPVFANTTGAANASLPATENFPNGGLPFEIKRRPEPSSAGSLQLPEGIVVDLAASGVGPSGLFTGLQDVTVMFSRNGQVERIIQGNTTIQPLSAIHFLVGQNVMAGAGDLAGNTPEEQNNWRSPDSIWVSVSPQTGLVGTYSNAIDADTANLTVLVADGIDNARAIAVTGQYNGGR